MMRSHLAVLKKRAMSNTQISLIKTLAFCLVCGLMSSIYAFNLSAQSDNNKELADKLEWISAGNGRASDGTFLDFTTYQNTKGTQVHLTKGKFTSPSAAEKEMSLWLKTATKVIEQSLVKEATGETIGKRAVASFSVSKSQGEYFAILWTNGSRYYWVSSSSLNLARDLENQINTRKNR